MIILASNSTNRKQALTLAKIPFKAVAANIDEKAIQHSNIHKRVELIALAKVATVAESESGIVLGADGVNVCNGRILEKPANLNEAREMLQFQSGKHAEFITAYAVLNTRTGKSYSGVTVSEYKFRLLADEEIETYINIEPVTTWAAAFSPINSSAITFVEWMRGNPAQFCFSMPFYEILPILRREISLWQ